MDTNKSIDHTENRSLLKQIYEFLLEMYNLQNPPVLHLSKHDWKLSLQQFADNPHIDYKIYMNQDDLESDADNYFFRVVKPPLNDCPVPPSILKSWLREGWDHPNVSLDSEIIIFQRSSSELEKDKTVKFTDSDDRVSAFREWKIKRNAWATKEKPAREADLIYNKLFGLKSKLDRESDSIEAVIGDGVLRWKFNKQDSDTNHIVEYPLLTHKIELNFDPNIPSFQLSLAEISPELNLSLLRFIDVVAEEAIAESAKDLELNVSSILNHSETSSFLKRVASRISSRSQFLEFEEFKSDYLELPQIRREPILYLRKVTTGIPKALSDIIIDIQSNPVFSEAVAKLIGLAPSFHINQESSELSRTINVHGEDFEILLHKDANGDQLEIAKQLNRYGAVIVQGPPGTGKTHTIANLIGHYISEGKSILVTSHTSRALKVLVDKIDEDLRHFCVNLSDEGTAKQNMEFAVEQIKSRITKLNETETNDRIDELLQSRRSILRKMDSLRDSLKNARKQAFTSIIIDGQSYIPNEIAKTIDRQISEHGWIPLPINENAQMPLSHEELTKLYFTNQEISTQDEIELRLLPLKTSEIDDPLTFQNFVDEWKVCKNTIRSDVESWWKLDVPGEHQLESIIKSAKNVQNIFQSEFPWRQQIVNQLFTDSEQIQIWEEFIDSIKEVYELQKRCYRTSLDHDIVINDEAMNEENYQKLIQLYQSLGEHDTVKLGFFHFLNRSKYAFLKSCSFDGQTPTKPQQIKAVLDRVQLDLLRTKLRARWAKQVEPVLGPRLDDGGTPAEQKAYDWIAEIQSCLKWSETVWESHLNILEGNGFQIERLMEASKCTDLEHIRMHHIERIVLKVVDICEQSLFLHRIRKAQKERDRWLEKYRTISRKEPESELRKKLLRAVDEIQPQIFRDAYNKVQYYEKKYVYWVDRLEWLNKLRSVAPNWAREIEFRLHHHGASQVPGDANQAWLTRRLETKLRELDALDVDVLSRELKSLRARFKEETVQLIQLRSLLKLKEKTTDEQLQSLSSWLSYTKKIGKGTGKKAPIYIKSAKQEMIKCQQTVPVWIMPMEKVMQNFHPASNRFDLVIIDEASQSNLNALACVYLAKQVIVVGDDQQVSPESIGEKADEIRRLRETMLVGVPHTNHYEGSSSVYSMAKLSFPLVVLHEHFRCVAPIISFSNRLCYSGKIKPLRNAGFVKRLPHTVAYQVSGTIDRNTKTNVEEAETIVSLILAMRDFPEYDRATVGVITLLGDEQANLIDQRLRQCMDPREYESRQIRCGNSAQFQGDERDVMFLSMVHSSDAEEPLYLLSDAGEKMTKRYNVAVSRARDQVWVVHSLNKDVHLKPGDLRKKLLDHTTNPHAYDLIFQQHAPQTDSEFEKMVLKRLIELDYRVICQYPVGGYRIDLVVEGNGRQLAVECDGERFHGPEKLEEDMNRQAILERCGWTFHRIRGSKFFRNQDEEIKSLVRKLDEMEIYPQALSTESKVMDGEQLKNEVILRASEIRASWAE